MCRSGAAMMTGVVVRSDDHLWMFSPLSGNARSLPSALTISRHAKVPFWRGFAGQRLRRPAAWRSVA
jgi:hypothetical protein